MIESSSTGLEGYNNLSGPCKIIPCRGWDVIYCNVDIFKLHAKSVYYMSSITSCTQWCYTQKRGAGSYIIYKIQMCMHVCNNSVGYTVREVKYRWFWWMIWFISEAFAFNHFIRLTWCMLGSRLYSWCLLFNIICNPSFV